MLPVIITGASGFIGSHFHEVLPHDAICNLDLNPPLFAPASRYVQGDIRKAADMSAAIDTAQADEIISLAAEHKDFGVTRQDYFRTNEHGIRVVCEEAARAGIKKIVFYSSVAVYGAQDGFTTEATTPRPSNPYGESKLAAEHVLYTWAKEDPARRVIIFRPTVVFGERNVANMLRLMIQIDSGRYAHIGTAGNVKSIAYVKNLVAATLHARETCGPGLHIFNYADEPHLSVRDIADTIAGALGRRRPFNLPYAAAVPVGLAFDAAIALTGKDLPISSMRIKKALTATCHDATLIRTQGFKPQYTSKEGLQRMSAWYAREKAAGRPPVPGENSSG